jgi:chromosome segregation ATPase
MNVISRQRALIAGVVTVVLVLAILVSTSMNLRKFKKNFRDEMAQRLDLEERLLKAENERHTLLVRVERLENQDSQVQDEVASLKEALAKGEEEKKVLKASLEKAESQLQGFLMKK